MADGHDAGTHRVKITRTSVWDYDRQPLEGTEKGYFECPAGEITFWHREFDSLDQLFEFVKEHGNIVV